MSGSIPLSTAIEGFFRYMRAVGRSPHTISDYSYTFKKLTRYFPDDPAIGSLTKDKLVGFFAWLQEDYISQPNGVAPRKAKRLSSKTILNVHTGLSALWTWAVEEGYAEEHVVQRIERPATSSRPKEPITKDEVEALLQAARWTKEWKSDPGKRSERPTADRDIAMILLLLDTGIRASELASINREDLDLDANRVLVKGKGAGRDSKQRLVPFGPRTAKAIWRYVVTRGEPTGPEDPLFTVGSDMDWRPMTRHNLGLLLRRLGKKAGFEGIHPHRFRHTFAIQYLRNGGDIFTLQELLGHSTLMMVRRYARVAQVDIERSHKKASPVQNWRL